MAEAFACLRDTLSCLPAAATDAAAAEAAAGEAADAEDAADAAAAAVFAASVSSPLDKCLAALDKS